MVTPRDGTRLGNEQSAVERSWTLVVLWWILGFRCMMEFACYLRWDGVWHGDGDESGDVCSDYGIVWR